MRIAPAQLPPHPTRPETAPDGGGGGGNPATQWPTHYTSSPALTPQTTSCHSDLFQPRFRSLPDVGGGATDGEQLS